MYMKSFSSTAGDDESAAFSLNFPNEPWSGDFLFKQIGENFTPALGFVNRTAIRQYVGTVAHLTRYREHVSQHARIRHQFRIRHRSERRAGIARQRRLCEREVQDRRSGHVAIDQFVRERAGAVLPAEERAGAGRERMNGPMSMCGVRTFNGRLLTLQADVTCCSFYDGSAVVTRVTLIFRPSTYFEITARP